MLCFIFYRREFKRVWGLWGFKVYRQGKADNSNFFSIPWLGLAWLGLAWLGLSWLGLAWLGLAWPTLAWPGLAWLGLAWLGLSQAWQHNAHVHLRMFPAVQEVSSGAPLAQWLERWSYEP